MNEHSIRLRYSHTFTATEFKNYVKQIAHFKACNRAGPRARVKAFYFLQYIKIAGH
jgi:hypothetical protein